jgi:hypothetical protein
MFTRVVKMIVDPRRTERSEGAHHFTFAEGAPVDEREQPLDGAFLTRGVTTSYLRVNHYLTKSMAEWEQKRRVPRADTGRPWEQLEDLPAVDALLTEERDETILAYVPPLRQALAKRT